MLDVKLLRDDRDRVVAALERRAFDPSRIDEAIELDAARRGVQTELDAARAEQNRMQKDMPALQGEERDRLRAMLKGSSERITALESQERELAGRLREAMLSIPNLPDETAPAGETDAENVEVRRWGSPRAFDFPVRDHVELGTALDAIDIDRGVRTSGSRFYYVKGAGVMLEFALVRFALDTVMRHGFTPVVPPVLVRREAMEGTGFLPTDEAQIYRTADGDLYLTGTSEVPLAALHMDEFLDYDSLPVRYVGFSTCFRREAGTYGKDTRGIFRVHQFDKVEMFSFTRPGASHDEHEFLLSIQEEILQGLEIPYRVVNIAAGELGGSAAKKYDCEGWLPGQGAYRELTSCSNCTDYQARRLSCRARTADGPVFVHTLNGTAVAVARAIVAVLENHQHEDGGVTVPAALRPYLGRDRL